jgi:hypothetical protein
VDLDEAFLPARREVEESLEGVETALGNSHSDNAY